MVIETPTEPPRTAGEKETRNTDPTLHPTPEGRPKDICRSLTEELLWTAMWRVDELPEAMVRIDEKEAITMEDLKEYSTDCVRCGPPP